MMKKILAAAIVSAFAAPAFAATANVDVYGLMHVTIEDNNVSDSDIAVLDRVSRFGIKGTEDLGGGLAAIWQIETGLGSASTGGLVGGATSFANRNTYIGLKGGFGTVLAGRHDTPYKMSTGPLDLFADTAADYNYGGVGLTLAAKNALYADLGLTADEIAQANVLLGTGAATFGYINSYHDHRSPATVAYVSPDFGGLSFAGALVMTNNAAALNSGDSLDAKSLSVNYKNGPLFLGAGWQDVEVVDSTAWKVGGGLMFGNAKVGLIYENNKIDAIDLETKTWLLNGAYAMGAVTLKAQYAKTDIEVDGDLDATMWAVGVDYALSKRTTAYVLYTADKADRVDFVAGDYVANDDSIKTWGVGMKHSF